MNLSVNKNFLGAALLLVCGAFGCASKPNVDVFVTRIAPAPSTMLEQRTRIDVRIQNLGDKTLKAKGMAVELDLNGSRFARGVSNEAFRVPALGETTASIVLSTSLFDVLRQVLAFENRQSFEYRLKGRLYGAGGSRYRFNRKGEFSRRQLERLNASP